MAEVSIRMSIIRSAIVVTGVANVAKKMALFGLAFGQVFERNSKEAGRYILRESRKIVPVDTKQLHKSGFTRNFGGPGFAADIVVGYTKWYALVVHEVPATHKPPTTDKYLERILREYRTVINRIIGGKGGIA